MGAGNAQQVRRAVAQYFGGPQSAADEGIVYQNGPLTSLGLGSVFPYTVKGVPDEYYFTGMPDGTGWGAVMGLRMAAVITRKSWGGPTSGWRYRPYLVTCSIEVVTQLPHIEVAGAGLDDLLDGICDLIYADRTLGTTDADAYPTGRLITQAGEDPHGIRYEAGPFAAIDKQRGRTDGSAVLTFEAFTVVQS